MGVGLKNFGNLASPDIPASSLNFRNLHAMCVIVAACFPNAPHFGGGGTHFGSPLPLPNCGVAVRNSDVRVRNPTRAVSNNDPVSNRDRAVWRRPKKVVMDFSPFFLPLVPDWSPRLLSIFWERQRSWARHEEGRHGHPRRGGTCPPTRMGCRFSARWGFPSSFHPRGEHVSPLLYISVPHPRTTLNLPAALFSISVPVSL